MDAQADLSLRWARSHFDGFVMRRFKFRAAKTNNKKKKKPLFTVFEKFSFVMTFSGCAIYTGMRPKWLSFIMTFSGCAIYTGNETKMAQFCYDISGCAIYTGSETKMAQCCYDIFRVCYIHRQ